MKSLNESPLGVAIIATLSLFTVALVGLGNCKNMRSEPVWLEPYTPPPTIPLGVEAESGYKRVTGEAMNLWNSFVDCRLFDWGSDVQVKADDGEPCGDPWRPSDDEGHRATAYRCGSRYEIHLSQPGDVHDQLCLVAHELGHTLGLADDVRGSTVMTFKCLQFVRPSDADIKALRSRYCER